MLASITHSVFRYVSDPSSVSIEEHVVRHINSAAMPGAFNIRIGIETEDGKYLSYLYPDQVLRTGNKYSFTLLPNSDFVLKAETVK
jgi:hypothetical protein